MSSTQLILNYYTTDRKTKRLWWRRTLVGLAKLLVEFIWLAILALSAVWVGSALVASH